MRSPVFRSTTLVVFLAAVPILAAKPPVSVDCAKGQSINSVLATNADPLEIEFSGTCQEDVLITRDRITIRGTGASPAIVGAPNIPFADRKPAVSVYGADNVILAAFTADDSDSRGIEAKGSSRLIVDDVVATGSRSGLLLLEQSSALVRNSSFDGNTGDGIGVWDNSALMLEGAISASDNTRAGIIASGGSSITVSTLGANTSANDNLFGFLLQLGAQALMSSASPTNTTAAGNGSLGLSVTSESHWSGGVAVSSSDYGIAVESSASLAASPGAISVSSCFAGVYVAEDSQVTLTNVGLSGNDYGVYVDGGNAKILNSAISGSAEEDVHLEFGSRLISGGSSASVVYCDDTVLVRGGISCPPPALLSAPRLRSQGVRRSVRRETGAPLTMN